MIRYSAILFLVILVSSSFALFKVKFYVQNLRKDIIEIQKQISKEKNATHVLQAEWTYLNNPERLKKLTNKYMKLQPIKLSKIHKIQNNLPLYLSEDRAERDLYLASIELSKYAKPNKKIINRNAVLRVKNTKNRDSNRITKVKY